MMKMMMMTKNKYNMDFQIETRSSKEGDRPRYIVKGFATVPDHAYAYKYFKNGVSFKEMFTTKGVDNFVRKLKSKNVFVDALHEQGMLFNTNQLLKQIQTRTGVDISSEANQIISQIKHSDIPLAKFNSVSLEGNKPYIETELNPLYREVDEKHQKYFDAIWYSLQNGFLNKFSINFKPLDTESTVIDGEIIPKINDVDVFGISYTQGAANDMADITEVAMRSAMETDEVKRMEEEKTKKLEDENKALKSKLDEIKRTEQEKVEAEKKSKEDSVKRELETSKEEIDRQRKELQAQQEQIKKEMEELSKAKVASPEKSVAPSEDRFRKPADSPAQEVVKKVLELIPEVGTPKGGRRIDKYGFYKSQSTRPNMDGKIGMGELIASQGHTDAINLYPADTKSYLQSGNDIRITKQR